MVLEAHAVVVIFAKTMTAVERGSHELAAAATAAAIAALDDATPTEWLDAREHKLGAHGLTFGGVVVKVPLLTAMSIHVEALSLLAQAHAVDFRLRS